MHFLILGLFLGWGAAIPIGAVNLEIIRRNLNFGTIFGLSLGFGACIADLTYLLLLFLGALSLIDHPQMLSMVGILGSLILAWFGYKALTATPYTVSGNAKIPTSPLKNGIAGYLITLLNPYTILFWASISSQLALSSNASINNNYILLAGAGLLIGTVSWVVFLNTLLHYSRKKISPILAHRLNQSGGVILIAFAIYGGIRALNMLL